MEEMTLKDFLQLYNGGEAYISIFQEPYDFEEHQYAETYFEKCRPEEVVRSRNFGKIENIQIDSFNVHPLLMTKDGPRKFRVELCICLKGGEQISRQRRNVPKR